MSEKIMKKSRVLIAALLVTVMIAALTLWGCGTSSYSDPAASANITTIKEAALITPAILKDWMDAGKVNAPSTSYDRVVILTVGPAADATTTTTTNSIDNNATPADATDDKYVTTVKAVTSYGYSSHIPGAQLWNSGTELGFTRREGVADMTTMVPDGASMDTLIQRFGINKYTTVVLTVSKGQNYYNAARAYFTLRYWGFPKERLKVLDGGDDAWVDAGKTLTTVVPTIAKSTYSVRNNYTGNYASFGLRFSIGEMIALVDSNSSESIADAAGIAILDARGPSATVPVTYDYDKARVKYAYKDDYNLYSVAPAGISTSVGTLTTVTKTPIASNVSETPAKTTLYADKTRTYINSAADPADPTAVIRLTSYLTDLGVNATKKMTYVYCASGYRASVPFFVLDGILNRPVTLYDGSWGQWSGYKAANFPAGTSATWLVDTRSTLGTGTLIGTIPIADNLYLGFTSVLDPEANQILKADKIYFSTPPVSTSTSGGAAGGGSGC